LCIYCTNVSQLHQFPDVAALAKKAAVLRPTPNNVTGEATLKQQMLLVVYPSAMLLLHLLQRRSLL
jgi:hypothetical protein